MTIFPLSLIMCVASSNLVGVHFLFPIHAAYLQIVIECNDLNNVVKKMKETLTNENSLRNSKQLNTIIISTTTISKQTILHK